jgi:hypothetical protein
MKKKLGPLETWQWIAIAAAGAIAYYIYRQRHAAAANTAATTGLSPSPATDLGPIDPTTGQPFALEGAYTAGAASVPQTPAPSSPITSLPDQFNQNAGATSLQQELADLAAIQALQANAGQPAPTTSDMTAGQAGQNAISVFTSTAGAQLLAIQKGQSSLNRQMQQVGKQIKKLQQTIAHPATHRANPGHIVTTHPGGKRTAASSAPATSQQHKNIAPPSHQRHNPIRHPSSRLK